MRKVNRFSGVVKDSKAEPVQPANEPTISEPDKADKKNTHTQISAYIPNELYKSVRVALVGKKTADGAKLTLTDLLINLLSDWEREQE